VFQQLALAFAEVSRSTAGRMDVGARNVALARIAQRVPLLTQQEAVQMLRGMPGEPQVDAAQGSLR
jgi:hypothetical protein